MKKTLTASLVLIVFLALLKPVLLVGVLSIVGVILIVGIAFSRTQVRRSTTIDSGGREETRKRKRKFLVLF